jgi:hypothetical protein
MTIIQAAILGIMTGTLGTTGIFLWLSQKQDPTEQILSNQSETLKDLAEIQSKLQEGELEIQKNLTSTDLLEVSCSKDWMTDNTNMLCREMFCRLQTREGDAASQKECEEMANVANTFFIIEQCKKNQLEIDTCLKIIKERK